MSIEANLKKALEAISVGRAQLQQEVIDLAAEIAKLEGEKSRLLQLPISLDDYCNYMGREIKRRGEKFAKEFSGSCNARSHTGSLTHHKTIAWKDFESGAAQVLAIGLSDSISSDGLCFFFGEVLHERLAKAVRADQSGTWGNKDAMPSSERRSRIDQIEPELQALIKKRNDTSAELYNLDKALSEKHYA